MKVGIIANQSERNTTPPKWYEVWKRQAFYEVYKSSEQEFYVVFIPEKKKEKWIEKAEIFFSMNGISKIMYTKGCKERIDFLGTKEYTGKLILHMLAPKIIDRLAANSAEPKELCTVAYIDNSFQLEAGEVLREICRSCRHLYIISDNLLCAKEKAQELYDELGIAVEVIANNFKRIDCDYAVLVDGELPKIGSQAEIIDISGKLQRRAIKRLSLVLTGYKSEVPYILDECALAECLVKNACDGKDFISKIMIREIIRG